MNFRNSRGTRMKSLLDKENLEQELDDFWKENKYFGNIMGEQSNEYETDEDFNEDEIKSQQQDLFDSDFDDDTDDQSDEEDNEENKEKTKKKKSKFEILKKMSKQQKQKHHQIQEKTEQNENLEKRITRQSKYQHFNKFLSSKIFKKVKKNQGEKKESRNQESKQPKKRFIHEKYSQNQLLQEAKYLLQQELMKIEEEKKIYSIRKKFQINGPKYILKDNQKEKYIYCSQPELSDQLLPIKQFPLKSCSQPKPKYRDPKTKIGFNTIEEFKRILAERNKLQIKQLHQQIKFQTELIEKKEAILPTSYYFHGKSKQESYVYY